MPYQPNIPNPTDLLSDSQGDIKTNFQSSNTSFGLNHFAFDAVSDSGKHKFCEMVSQGAFPPGAFTGTLVAGEGTIFTNNVARTSPSGTQTRAELFFIPDDSGQFYQLTQSAVSVADYTTYFGKNVALSTSGGGATGTGGWTFLPGGLIFQYGTVTVALTNNLTTVNFPIPFKTGSVPFSIVLTPINSSGSNSPSNNAIYVKSGTETNVKFGITSTSSGQVVNCYFTAIGK